MKDANFLVVDDCISIRGLLKSAIYNRFDCKSVHTAGNGKQAIEILKSQKIDIIISDWIMPQMCGIELLEYIRSESKYRDIPFILMSNRDGKDDIVAAIQKGVDHYIVKPFTTAKLEAAVNESWNMIPKRSESRISHLPTHTLRLHYDNQMQQARLINISLSGALLEVPAHPELHLLEPVTLHFSMEINEFETFRLTGIKASVIRLEARFINNSSEPHFLLAILFDQDNSNEHSLMGVSALLDKLQQRLQ